MTQLKSHLVVNNLCAGYDEKIILEDINLTFASGKITILIGANGCGKSTLLKTIARILLPISGNVLLQGQDIHKANTKKVAQQLAFLPQETIAPEGLTVRELVSQGRFAHQSFFSQNIKADSDAVDYALNATNMLSFANTPIHSMSGGQKQRAWIAMALAQETPFLLLDEPTTFLDMQVQLDILSVLKKACLEHNKTLIIVLHELNMAAAFADELVMLKNGKVFAKGTPKEIFTKENLKQVFNLDANVIEDPIHHNPVCLPILKDYV